MSDQNDTPDTPDTTPKQEPAPPRDDAYAAALKSITAERDGLAKQLEARDRKIADLTGERDGFKVQIEEFGRRARETAIVERLQATDEAKHLGAFELRAALKELHGDDGFDRFAEDAEGAAKTALDRLKVKAPALMRPPAQGGGPGGAPPVTGGPRKDPLRALFGARGK